MLLFSAEMLYNVWRYRSWKFKTFTYGDEDDDDDDDEKSYDGDIPARVAVNVCVTKILR